MNEPQTLGQRLQRLRETRRPVKSRRVVSELIGLNHDMLRRYERDEAKPSLDALLLLCDYYGVTADYLLGR